MRLAPESKGQLGHAADNCPLTVKWKGKAKLPWESIFSLVIPAFLFLLALSSHFPCQPTQPRRKIRTPLDCTCHCVSPRQAPKWSFSGDTNDKQLPGNYQRSLNCAGLYMCLGRLLYLMFQEWSLWTHRIYFNSLLVLQIKLSICKLSVTFLSSTLSDALLVELEGKEKHHASGSSYVISAASWALVKWESFPFFGNYSK